MLFKKICLGILISFLLLATYAIQAGIAIVDVNTPDLRLWIPVPIVLGHVAGEFVDLPLHQERDFRELLEYKEVAAQLLRQLKDIPDADLVEIQRANEQVRIFKQADAIWVKVINPNGKIQVRVPLKAVENLVAVLESPNATVGDLISCLEWQRSGDLVHIENGKEKIRISIL
jgi:hypothetical protein